MISEALEYNIILLGWVIAFLLGILLLVFKTPQSRAYAYYKQGKNTLGVVFLLFGCEILFQWFLRFFHISDPILSVSVYLLAFCAASLLIMASICILLRPGVGIKKIQRYVVVLLLAYFILLVINYLLPSMRWRTYGVLVCCALLFLLVCHNIYLCYVAYKDAITDLRKYYSEFVESMMRWMPGVGIGIVIFLLSAPIVCICPRWVGVYQMSLGIIMFIYTFICVINFSSKYSSYATALNIDEENQADDELLPETEDKGDNVHQQRAIMSESLREVMQEKELRWHEHGGYQVPGVTIEQAAREMGTNRSYLSRYLNEVRNMTFYEWVAQMRIREAKDLIDKGTMSMDQIAHVVGYSSYSTFSSTFKKVTGMSPNAWRNRK